MGGGGGNVIGGSSAFMRYGVLGWVYLEGGYKYVKYTFKRERQQKRYL
jgi:hypothetical protein